MGSISMPGKVSQTAVMLNAPLHRISPGQASAIPADDLREVRDCFYLVP